MKRSVAAAISEDMNISIRTAAGCDTPCEISAWWICPLSAERGLFPVSILRMTEYQTSAIGTARKREVGEPRTESDRERERTAIEKPRNCEPESPMNTLARYLLCGINPKSEKNRVMAISALSASPRQTASRKSERSATRDSPPASPSSPSEKLTAFIINTILKTARKNAKAPEIGKLTSPKRENLSGRDINAAASAAATSCRPSFGRGGIP